MEVQRRLNVKIMRRKLGLFGHRIDNSRKIKSVMTGMMAGTKRKEDRAGSG